MNNYLNLIIVACIALTQLSCTSVALNRATATELTLNTATIVAGRDGAYFLVVVDLATEIPSNTHAIIRYQTLSNPQKYKTLDLGNIADSRRITFKSKPAKKVHIDTGYQVDIQLFENANKTTVVAQRSIISTAKIPTKIAEILDIELL